MREYLTKDEWKIIENTFDPDLHQASESLFSIGNGYMGQRANFEELYSGPGLQGNYIAGIYYPDKTKVGWWKNGYPEYFAKVLNAPDWIRLNIIINNHVLDLYKMEIHSFQRVLDMKKGVLERNFEASFPNGNRIKVEVKRFLSIRQKEIAALKYTISPLNFDADIKIESYLDGNIKNQDANYGESFWDAVDEEINDDTCFLEMKTRKTDFYVCLALKDELRLNQSVVENKKESKIKEKSLMNSYSFSCKENEVMDFYKVVSVTTSRDYPPEELREIAYDYLKNAWETGFDQLLKEHQEAWGKRWDDHDVKIEGDVSAQQGIRFNIFQLYQTYSGHDARLNIGPKGFTGEKYGGSTYWDTEAYCLPFFLNAKDTGVARNLLIYRYKHLQQAIENAEKLGFENGAALYPMVTMNGEECHNEWEITFEEIHRNGAIVFAIYNYIRHTGDEEYLSEYGLEVIIAVARFWAQRVNFSRKKAKYVILGVTGPNEYENNVNNNWYTNYLARWTLSFALDSLAKVKKQNQKAYDQIIAITHFDQKEVLSWKDIIDNMYLPEDDNLGVFLQQDGFLDKELVPVKELNPLIRPLNQNWSWDRILRSCYIKQADVLQGLYFFEDQFSEETIRRNFEFYEPLTVHESSLSPCVHSILAAKLGENDLAYDLYLRTSRLDLDDYNHEVHEGCHITSMAGTWLSIVEGFGGMKVKEDALHFNPLLPDHWESLSFKVYFRSAIFALVIKSESIEIKMEGKEKTDIFVNDRKLTIQGSGSIIKIDC